MSAYAVALKIVDLVSGPLARIQAGLGAVSDRFSTTGEAAKRADASMGMFGKAFQLNQITMAVDTLGNAFNKMLGPSMNFDAQMSELKAVAEPTGAEFTKLREKALQLGIDTKFSATQAAEGLTELSKAGFSAKNATQAIDGVLNLAAASGMELGRSAEIVANNMAAFALDAGQATRVSDVFAKTVNMSTVGMEDMAEAMKYIAPTANALGMSIEETSGMIGVLGDYGMKGSIATRALGTSLQRFSKPTTQMAEKMAELGFSIFDSTGTFKGMANVVEELTKKTAGFTQEQKMSAVATLFGADASGEVLTLMKAQKIITISALNEEQQKRLQSLVGMEAYNKAMESGGEITLQGANALRGYTQVLEGSAGASSKMAKTMIDNLKGDVTILGSSVEGMMIRMGDSTAGFGRGAIQSITEFVNAVSANFIFVEQIFSALSSALSPVFNAIGAGFGNVGSVTDVTKSVMEGLANIITNVVAPSISFIATVLSPFIEGLAIMASFIIENSSWLSVLAVGLGAIPAAIWAINIAMAANPVGLIIAGIALVLGLIKMAYDNFEGFRMVVDAVGSAGRTAFEAIGDALDWVWKKLTGFIDSISDLYNGFMDVMGLGDTASSKIAETSTKMGDGMSGGGMFGLINKGSERIKDGVGGLMDKVGGVKNAGLKLLDGILGKTDKNALSALAMANSGVSTGVGATAMSKLKSSDDNKKGINEISAGGNKQLHITVQIAKMQASEKIEVHTSDTSENAYKDIESKIVTTVTRALNGAIQMQTQF